MPSMIGSGDAVVIPRPVEPIQPPSVPPENPGGRSPRRDGLLVALAALAGAVVVLGGLAGVQWLRVRSDEVTIAAEDEPPVDVAGDVDADDSQATDSDSDDSDSTGDQDDSGDSVDPDRPEPKGEDDPFGQGTAPPLEPVETAPCPQRYSDTICDAADFVQQVRGRPFKEFPEIELLEDAAFDEALVEDLDESQAELLLDEQLLKSLGLLQPDIDLFATFESLIEAGVVGFYDPDDGRLVVRGGQFDLYGQAILIHELVHAFDDQWFDLSRDDFPNDDAEYGYTAIVEGNANRVEQLWRDRLSDKDRALLLDQERSSLSAEDLQRLLSLPQILLNLQASPYEDGERYVTGLTEAGGEQAIDDRFAEPPESSEAVLHPDGPALDVIAVEAPPVAGPVLAEDRLGELLLRFWLGEEAAEGWGGDTAVIWESDSQICTTVDLAADSDSDSAEMLVAAERWASRQADQRRVESIDDGDLTLIRITGCY